MILIRDHCPKLTATDAPIEMQSLTTPTYRAHYQPPPEQRSAMLHTHRARPPRNQETLQVDGRVQAVRECGDHDRWHRTGPPDSQGTILVWPWTSGPPLVTEGGMGDDARIEEELEA